MFTKFEYVENLSEALRLNDFTYSSAPSFKNYLKKVSYQGRSYYLVDKKIKIISKSQPEQVFKSTVGFFTTVATLGMAPLCSKAINKLFWPRQVVKIAVYEKQFKSSFWNALKNYRLLPFEMVQADLLSKFIRHKFSLKASLTETISFAIQVIFKLRNLEPWEQLRLECQLIGDYLIKVITTSGKQLPLLVLKSHYNEGKDNILDEVYRVDLGSVQLLRKLKKISETRIKEWQEEVSLYQSFKELPHVIKCYEVIENKENSFFAIFIEKYSCSLLEVLREAPKVKDYLCYIRQILRFLSELHQKNWVHRDIKPENIFFQEGNLFVGDFGVMTHATAKHRVMGTPLYQPIEALAQTPDPENHQKFLKGIDNWAVGLIAFLFKYKINHEIRYQLMKKYSKMIRAVLSQQAGHSLDFSYLVQELYPIYRQDDLKDKNYIETFNQMVFVYFGPRLTNEIKKIRSHLDPQDPYDKIVLGLLELDYTRRWSADQALSFLENAFFKVQSN